MNLLAVGKKPYYLSFAVFNYEKRSLKKWGIVYFTKKDTNDRIIEIRKCIQELLTETTPAILVTHWVDLERTLKKDLENMFQIKTLLREECIDRKIIYNEFKTLGWEKKITNQTKPSKKAKILIAKQYSKMIDNVEIADAIILGEGVVYNRLQVGRD